MQAQWRFFVRRLVLFTSLSACLSACTRVEERLVQQAAPTDMNRSFALDESKDTVRIEKAALGKLFLLVTSAFQPGRTGAQADFQPRIVVFERHRGALALFEVEADTVYDAFPNRRLVQSFAIHSQSETSIEFIVGKGIESFTVDPSVGGFSTPESSPFGRGGNDARVAVSFSDSVVKDLSLSSERIDWVQSVRINYSDLNQTKTIWEPEASPSLVSFQSQAEFLFQFEAYRPNPKFVPKAQEENMLLGFFARKLNKSKGKLKLESYIQRWDLERGPIEVWISENTPAHFLSAVVEGVEYWNRVLGSNVLVVKTGVSLETRPAHRTVFVRWIDYKNAGMAYAGLQADPITGEIVRGQVYMTSLGAEMETDDETPGSSSPTALERSPTAALLSTSVCRITSADLSKRLAQLQHLNLEERKLAHGDLVRMVMAHEMGHVMGLRHNFAASQVSPKSAADVEEDYLNSLRSNTDFPYEVSSSVMDYVFDAGGNAVGRRVKSNALSFDVISMQWPKTGDTKYIKPNDFCTDEHRILSMFTKRPVYGCKVADTGNPAADVLTASRDSIGPKAIAKSLIKDVAGKMAKGKAFEVAVTEAISTGPITFAGSELSLPHLVGSLTLDNSPVDQLMSISKAKELASEADRSNWTQLSFDPQSANGDSDLAKQIKEDLTKATGNGSFWDELLKGIPREANGAFSGNDFIETEVRSLLKDNNMVRVGDKPIRFTPEQIEFLAASTRGRSAIWVLNNLQYLLSPLQPYKDRVVKLPVYASEPKPTEKEFKQSLVVHSKNGLFTDADYERFMGQALALYLSPVQRLTNTLPDGKSVTVIKRALPSTPYVEYNPNLLKVFLPEHYSDLTSGAVWRSRVKTELLSNLAAVHRSILGTELKESDTTKLRTLVYDWSGKKLVTSDQAMVLLTEIGIVNQVNALAP